MKKLAILVLLAASALPSVAAAQGTITVLGLRSATADETVAENVTNALRQAAESATSSGLTHSGRENHLTQLLLVFDCEEPSEDCMQQIGESLNSDRLIYGLVEPESGRANAGYAVALSFFNVESGRVERTLREVIPRDMSAEDMIEPIAVYYSAITGTVVTGELAIRCNVAGARVSIGGNEVGTTGDEPLVLRELEPGQVSLVVEHDDYATYRESVNIESGQLREVEVTLSETGQGPGDPDGVDPGDPDPVPPPGTGQRRSLAWLGWTFGGLAVASLAVGIWQGADIYFSQRDFEDNDPDRDNWGEPGQEVDICAAARDGQFPSDTSSDPAQRSREEMIEFCDSYQASTIVQFVMYGTAAAFAAVAIWLLVREYTRDDDSGEASRRRFSVAPMVLNGGGALSATLDF